MAREYARTHISIAEDEDFEDLTADAQWLYLRVMIPDPSLNHCGVIDWRPNRLVTKARGMTIDRILNAAGELEEREYARFDLATEEALVRTYIRSDELLRNPKMAACVVKAYRATASKTLRAVVVSEVEKAHVEHPEFSSWTHKDTAEDLSKLMARPNLSVVGYTNQIANPEPVQNTNGIANQIGDRNTYPDPGPEYLSQTGPDSLHLAPNTLHHSPTRGYVTGEPHQAHVPEPGAPPPKNPWCENHPGGTDRACRRCRDARTQFETSHTAERATAAQTRNAAINACNRCGEDGALLDNDGLPVEPLIRCNHQPPEKP